MRTFQLIFLALVIAFSAGCAERETPASAEPQTIPGPATGDVAGPRFSQGPNQELVLSWMERGSAETYLKYAALPGDEFSEAREVVAEPRMFVNWADLPSVTPVDGDHWVAHWLRYSADKTYSYDVVVSQSFDGGISWGEARAVHSDGTQTEHGFVSLAPDTDGVSLLWLDGRYTPAKSMTLRSAVLQPDGKLASEQEVDSSVCDCCQTAIAVASSGPIAVYRDRTSDEIRDIYVSRNIEGRWSTGKRLFADDWHIPGCPVNGPAIVANGQNVAVAWFSAANGLPVVRVIRSADSGVSFDEPIEIAAGAINGYVGLAAMEQGRLAVSWVSKGDSGDNVIRVRSVSAQGKPGVPRDIGSTRQLRVVPQLAFKGDHLWFAWTDEEPEGRELLVARLPAAAL